MSLNKLSHVWSEVNRRYKAQGMEILGGFSTSIVPALNSSPFNYIREGSLLKSTSGGIANDEANFLYLMCELYEPKNILVIGNSYGFSMTFLSLANPDAKVIGFDKFRTNGIEVTKNLIKDLNNKWVVKGSTPDDIPKLTETYLDGSIDLVLVDAVHTNEMQTAEWSKYLPYLSDSAVVVFHDVLSCGLLESYEALNAQYKTDFEFRLVLKSSSGMGLAIRKQNFEKHENLFDYFCPKTSSATQFATYLAKNFNESAACLNEGFDEEGLIKPNHPQI